MLKVLADTSSLSCRFGGFAANRKRTQMKIHQVGPITGMLNLDSDDLSSFVKIEHSIGRYLTRVNAGTFLKLDIKRIGVGVVFKFHNFSGLIPMVNPAIGLAFIVFRFLNGQFASLNFDIGALFENSSLKVVCIFH